LRIEGFLQNSTYPPRTYKVAFLGRIRIPPKSHHLVQATFHHFHPPLLPYPELNYEERGKEARKTKKERKSIVVGILNFTFIKITENLEQKGNVGKEIPRGKKKSTLKGFELISIKKMSSPTQSYK